MIRMTKKAFMMMHSPNMQCHYCDEEEQTYRKALECQVMGELKFESGDIDLIEQIRDFTWEYIVGDWSDSQLEDSISSESGIYLVDHESELEGAI